MQSAEEKLREQEKVIKFLASKYQRDTGRKITLPSSLSKLLDIPSAIGEHPLIQEEDEKFDENARKGRLAAETLKKPTTFFEAVEALRLPRAASDDDKKKGAKKVLSINMLDEHAMIQKIDLSGYKHLRFSKAGLQELIVGVMNLPCIRVVSLKNNGISDEHDKEILQLLGVSKIRSLDLSCNEIGPALGQKIGQRMRDEVHHLQWIDLTQNLFLHDNTANTACIAGLRRQKELRHAGLSVAGAQVDALAKLIQPKKPAFSLNMRNSTLTPHAMEYITRSIQNPHVYLIGLSFKFCYLSFNDVLLLAESIKFNHSLIKLDMSNNAMKACTVKFLLDSLVDNNCLADLKLAGNYLDDEFAVDLAHLLEINEVLHTVDISKNPIGPDGARYLLQSLLQNNDTLESLGDELESSIYMGVRIREELKQTL